MAVSVWDTVQILINVLTEQSNILHIYRDSLYFSDVNRDRQLYHAEFCADCGGLCATKGNKLHQLRQLTRKVDRLADNLSEILTFKSAVRPLPEMPQTPPPENGGGGGGGGAGFP